MQIHVYIKYDLPSQATSFITLELKNMKLKRYEIFKGTGVFRTSVQVSASGSVSVKLLNCTRSDYRYKKKI